MGLPISFENCPLPVYFSLEQLFTKIVRSWVIRSSNADQIGDTQIEIAIHHHFCHFML